MPVRVEVELDIFSGMPNPTWTLSEVDGRAFLTRVAELPIISARKLSDNLGYRGFSLDVLSGTETRHIRVQNGLVQALSSDAEVFYSDRNRMLERWLLHSGWPYLDNKVRSIMATEFSKE